MLAWNRSKFFGILQKNLVSTTMFCLVVFLCVSLFPVDVFAQEVVPPNSVQTDTFGVGDFADQTVLGSGDIRVIIAQIINVFLGLLGVIFVVIVIYAGYLWMTANGNEDNITRAKKILVNAVIGLVIILSAFIITRFIINALRGATGFRISEGGNGGRPQIASFAGSGSLGSVVRDHYPFRDQEDVKRNTKIIVTFAEPVDPASLIENTNQTCWPIDGVDPVSMVDNEANCLRDGAGNIVEYYGDCLPAVDGEEFNWEASCDHLKIDAVRIFPTADENIRVQAAAMTMYEGEDLSVFTFVFRPFQFLEDTVPYTVYLSNQIMKQQVNESIFAQQRFSYYTWEFSTGSDFDFDPPVVQSTYPAFTGEEQVIPRNTILQVTFNEAMDPLAVAGQFSPPNGTFSHIVLNTSTINTNPAADYHPQFSGEWVISNGYRTIEFVPNDECGRNACGEPIYCLPVNDKNGEDRMHALLRTARTNGVDAQDFSAIPFSGIADVSGNALDGNKDGVRDNKPPINDPFRITIPAQGNPDGAIDERLADNFYWTFRVADEIDNTVPYVQQVFPGLDQEDVVETENVLITFSKPMISRSLSHIAIEEHPGDIVDDSLWFRTRSSLNGNGDTVAEIDHRALGPSGLDLYYFTSIPTSVRSLNQNCLYPGRGPIGTPEDERNVSPVCEYDSESGVDRNCVPVTFEQTKDTACVQTTNQDVLPILQPDIATCLEGMKQEIVSPRFDNILDEGE